MSSAIAFTDGGSHGNPGPGAWASIIFHPEKNFVKEIAGYSKKTTNNIMELTAALQTLETVKDAQLNNLIIYSDSKYLVEGMNNWIHSWVKKNWIKADKKPVANKEIWQELHTLRQEIKFTITFKHIKGHSGFPANERADELVQVFALKQSYQLFSGDINKYSFLTKEDFLIKNRS